MTKSTATNTNKAIALLKTLLKKSNKRLQDTISACEDEKRRLKKQLGIKRAAFQKQISQRYIKLYEKYKLKCRKDQDKVIAALKKKITDQEIELKLYRDKAKGRSTKESLDSSAPKGGGLLDANSNSARNSSETKKKGKRRNAQGYGRKQHKEPLSEQETYHTLSDNECNCTFCGAPRKDLNSSEDSEEIDYQIKIVRIKHKRKVYKKTCECKNEPLFKTAPKPPRALPKGKYSDNLYLETVLSKYLYQIPTNVFISQLADQGLKGVNPSTLCNGIKRVDKFMQPLYEELIKRNKTASHWHDDESRLGVFIPS
jgi:transposase